MTSYWQTAKEYTNQVIAGDAGNESTSSVPAKKEPIQDGWIKVDGNKKNDDEWDTWDDTGKESPKPAAKSRLSLAAEDLSDSEVDSTWNEASNPKTQSNDDGWNDAAAESDGDEWESWS